MATAEAAQRLRTETEATAVRFAAAARLLSLAGRRAGLVVPTFRTPPRVVGLDRTLKRHGEGATLAVRLKGRPWAAVVADMVEGIVAVNRLDARRASRVRADLWEVIHDAGSMTRVA